MFQGNFHTVYKNPNGNYVNTSKEEITEIAILPTNIIKETNRNHKMNNVEYKKTGR